MKIVKGAKKIFVAEGDEINTPFGTAKVFSSTKINEAINNISGHSWCYGAIACQCCILKYGDEYCKRIMCPSLVLIRKVHKVYQDEFNVTARVSEEIWNLALRINDHELNFIMRLSEAR